MTLHVFVNLLGSTDVAQEARVSALAVTDFINGPNPPNHFIGGTVIQPGLTTYSFKVTRFEGCERIAVLINNNNQSYNIDYTWGVDVQQEPSANPPCTIAVP